MLCIDDRSDKHLKTSRCVMSYGNFTAEERILNYLSNPKNVQY